MTWRVALLPSLPPSSLTKPKVGRSARETVELDPLVLEEVRREDEVKRVKKAGLGWVGLG